MQNSSITFVGKITRKSVRTGVTLEGKAVLPNPKNENGGPISGLVKDGSVYVDKDDIPDHRRTRIEVTVKEIEEDLYSKAYQDLIAAIDIMNPNGELENIGKDGAELVKIGPIYSSIVTYEIQREDGTRYDELYYDTTTETGYVDSAALSAGNIAVVKRPKWNEGPKDAFLCITMTQGTGETKKSATQTVPITIKEVEAQEVFETIRPTAIYKAMIDGRVQTGDTTDPVYQTYNSISGVITKVNCSLNAVKQLYPDANLCDYPVKITWRSLEVLSSSDQQSSNLLWQIPSNNLGNTIPTSTGYKYLIQNANDISEFAISSSVQSYSANVDDNITNSFANNGNVTAQTMKYITAVGNNIPSSFVTIKGQRFSYRLGLEDPNDDTRNVSWEDETGDKTTLTFATASKRPTLAELKTAFDAAFNKNIAVYVLDTYPSNVESIINGTAAASTITFGTTNKLKFSAETTIEGSVVLPSSYGNNEYYIMFPTRTGIRSISFDNFGWPNVKIDSVVTETSKVNLELLGTLSSNAAVTTGVPGVLTDQQWQILTINANKFTSTNNDEDKTISITINVEIIDAEGANNNDPTHRYNYTGFNIKVKLA